MPDFNRLIKYILLIFAKETKRGNLENSFTAIGSSVLIGGAIGGSYGIYDGVRETAKQQMKGKLRRTQILNHTLKSGKSHLILCRNMNEVKSTKYIYNLKDCLLYNYIFIIIGGSVSNALGSIAVVYSSLYLLANQIYEEEDEAKSCITGAATGMFEEYISGLFGGDGLNCS